MHYSYTAHSFVNKKDGKCFKILNSSCLLSTVLPAKSDGDFMFCLQSYQGLIIDRSFVY